MEWPQIVTTITEGNAISTVVDAPWVSVTSVNGMSGDVITEPIMEISRPIIIILKIRLLIIMGCCIGRKILLLRLMFLMQMIGIL